MMLSIVVGIVKLASNKLLLLVVAARIYDDNEFTPERSTRQVRISTWRIFQLTESSRVGWILDKTSE
jgi:hypothetical protein